MENIFLTPIIQKAFSGPPGTPDWAAILQLIHVAQNEPAIINQYVSVINQQLERGKKMRQINVVMFLDALFKNCKKLQLLRLQHSKQLLQNLDKYTTPETRSFIMKNTPEWIRQCSVNDCLEPTFNEWVVAFCQKKYIPIVTPSIRKKFNKDFSASMEVLTMFSQCMVAAYSDVGNAGDPLLLEILPNVREIGTRIGQLEEMLTDVELLDSVRAIRDLSGYLLTVYYNFQKTAFLNPNEIATQVESYQKRFEAKKEPPPPSDEFEPIRSSDISDADFFKKLAEIRESQFSDSYKTEKITIDSLIDF